MFDTVKWHCNGSTPNAGDRELVSLMKDAGCQLVGVNLDEGNLEDKDKAIDVFSKVQLRLAFKVKVGYPNETMSDIIHKTTYLENNSLLVDPEQYHLLPSDDKWVDNEEYILCQRQLDLNIISDTQTGIKEVKQWEGIRCYLTDMSTMDTLVASSNRYFNDTDLLVIKELVRRKGIESLLAFSHQTRTALLHEHFFVDKCVDCKAMGVPILK